MKRLTPGKLFLVAIFLLAGALRLLWFPQNVYFGFDQARDAYQSIDIYKNWNIKIIGPSSSLEGLYHGPLYWYLIGPFYLLGGGNPIFPAFFLIMLNSLGVFVIWLIGREVAGEKGGLFAAFLYAVSFEQTQYAMYFGNPAPAILSVMLFYLGFIYLGVKKKWWGLPLAIAGLGLSVQFEFFLLYLAAVGFTFCVLFYKSFKLLNQRRIILTGCATLLSFSTFILADIIYGARTIKTLTNIIVGGTSSRDYQNMFAAYLERMSLQARDNIFAFDQGAAGMILLLTLIAGLYIAFKKSKERPVITIILVWVLSSFTLMFFGGYNLYYSNIGISAGIIVLSSFFLVKVSNKNMLAAVLLTSTITLGNLSLVYGQNKKGIVSDIYVQEGMLLKSEEKIIDYIYQTSGDKQIVVSATTMPLHINTTWAYLFNWYGHKKYGKTPFWAGETADGYPGSLPRWKSQTQDYTMFTIVEPTRGVRQAFIDNFLKEQEQYGDVMVEKRFGYAPASTIVLQRRK